jgi:hypothetical protein
MMRVPLNVGLPWQIFGSATMYWPNSTRSGAGLEADGLPFFMSHNLSLKQARSQPSSGKVGYTNAPLKEFRRAPQKK